jgi:zinc transport system substrate-binding protein
LIKIISEYTDSFMKTNFTIFLLVILIFSSCGREEKRPMFAATSPPVAAILQEITRGRVHIESMLPPGASPHTYSPKPSESGKLQSARGVFFVSPVLDAWAVNYNMNNKVALLKLLPNEYIMKFDDGTTDDPHFWTDPIAVKAMLPALARKLSDLDPAGAETYKKNATIFAQSLDSIDNAVRAMLEKDRGKTVFLFHPSMRYFLRRYGLIYGGSVETSPGKEPTPRFIAYFIEQVRASGVKVIFTEPQFTELPARSIAATAGVAVSELDPLGGLEGRKTYRDLIMYNARVLAKELGR